MDGKIVMVTGATAGIGRATALGIARMGARVIVVGRDALRSQAVVRAIIEETGNDSVEYLLADLSSIEQTRALAEAFTARFDRLHVLVNNVGAMHWSRTETVDGIESTFALDHLVGYFLLTHLLLDVIRASAPARIVNVSSDAHFRGEINFDDLEARQNYSAFGAYSNAKLANVLFTYELARRLQGTGVTVNALHPGMVASNFGLTNNADSIVRRLLRRVFDIFSINESEGAETSIYLATSPEVEGVTGKYFEKKREKRSSEASYDVATQQRLWTISEQMLGLAHR